MLRKPSIPDDTPNAHLYYDHTKFIEILTNNPPHKLVLIEIIIRNMNPQI